MRNLSLNYEPINPYLVPVANRDFIQIKLIETLVIINRMYKEIHKEIHKDKTKNSANIIIDQSNQIQGLIKRFGSIGVFIIIPSEHI
jgi:hypothetical protein